MSRPRLWIPGPTEVAPEILELMSRPVIGHRSPEIRELIGAIEPGLQRLFGAREVLVMTCSGTTVMEAALRSLVGRRVLVLSCGAFGTRWHEIAEACGIDSELVQLDAGEAVSPELASEHLAGKDFDAVCLTHSETSTGVLNPIERLVPAIRAAAGEVSILIDAVSSLSAVELDFDALGADLLLAGVQKAMALPPGIAVCALSAPAIAKAERLPRRGYTSDLLRVRAAMAKHQTPATPSVSHLFALRRQLERIHEEGLAARARRHRLMQERVAAWAEEKGHAVLAAPGFRSPTVSCLKVAGAPPPEILRQVLEATGAQLGGGYGDLKPEWFRIGHMGEHQIEELEPILAAIDRAS